MLRRISLPLLLLAIMISSSSAVRPRAFGIFVGVSTYKNGETLPFCADDAKRLGSYFMKLDGMLNIPTDRSIVLTDSAASLSAIKSAFESVRSRMNGDDILVFYFSGHGGGEDEPDAPPRDERDEHDETLTPWDGDGTHRGEFSDDKLKLILRNIPARNRILILDACFSGGFVDDLADSHTLVLAATPEDQSSMVAYAHRISGALTHSLLTGLSGEADADHDLAVSPTELIRHLSRMLPRYCPVCGRRNPPERTRCYHDRKKLGGPGSRFTSGGQVELRALSFLSVPYRSEICDGADEMRSCARMPSRCRCEVKGECGGGECMTTGRKTTDGCGTEEDRATCIKNNELCPCPDYGNCRMPGCRSPEEPLCAKEDDRARCEENPEDCPCGHFGDCEMASCARKVRRR